MVKGFKEFLFRGNIIDLAVAVVIGTAFGKVVEAFAKDVIGDLLALFGDTKDFDTVSLGSITIGTTITALINFVIVAAVIYFLVLVPMNKLTALTARPTAEPAEVAEVAAEVALLTEIRDLLVARNPSPEA